jgi:hypothetical protein
VSILIGNVPITNTSGIVGVHFVERHSQWFGKLTFKNKTYKKGFEKMEDAIEYRKSLEKKYLGPTKYIIINENDNKYSKHEVKGK